MTCERRYGGVVRDLGCGRLEHGYRSKSLLWWCCWLVVEWPAVLCLNGINSVCIAASCLAPQLILIGDFAARSPCRAQSSSSLCSD